jgi:ankyrin repeat protein
MTELDADSLARFIRDNNAPALISKIDDLMRTEPPPNLLTMNVRLPPTAFRPPGQSGAGSPALPLDNLRLVHIAATYDALECFIYLLAIGFDIGAKSAKEYLPIHYAVYAGAIEVVSYTLTHAPGQANVNANVPADAPQLLELAAQADNPAILSLLLASGLDVFAPQFKFTKVVAIAHAEVFKILITKYTERPQSQAHKNYSPVMLALARRCPELALEFVTRGCDVKRVVALPGRPAAYAVGIALSQLPGVTDPAKIESYLNVIRAIQARNEPIDIVAPDGGESDEMSAIHWACQTGILHVIQEVVRLGADVNKQFLSKIPVSGGAQPPSLTCISRLMSLGESIPVPRVIEILEWLFKEGGLDRMAASQMIAECLVTTVARKRAEPVVDWFFRNMGEHIKVKEAAPATQGRSLAAAIRAKGLVEINRDYLLPRGI